MNKFIYFSFLFFLNIGLAQTETINNLEISSVMEDEDLRRYIEDFPINSYKIYHVAGQGSFYIEPDLTDFIKSPLRMGRVWEKNILDLIVRYSKEGSVVIDAGAHIGTHTMTMANAVGENGLVYAFEPQKKIYRELVKNLSLNKIQGKVIPLRYALGDKEGVVELSPLHQGNEAGTPIGNGGDRVKMRTIDSFNINNLSLIKIDVEGWEDSVLEGARRTIEENHPVIIIEIQGGYEYSTAPEEVKKAIDHTKSILTGMGYDVRNLCFHDYLALPKNFAEKNS